MWPPHRRQDALETRHQVLIDVEPTRLLVYGDAPSVESAVLELSTMFREHQQGNETRVILVSKRASHRIGLWAITQRLQRETNTRVVVNPNNTVSLTGPKHVIA